MSFPTAEPGTHADAGRGVILTPTQIEQVLKAAAHGPTGIRNEAIVLVLFGTGLSIEQMCSLRVRHFVGVDGHVLTDAHLDDRARRLVVWHSARAVAGVERYLVTRMPRRPERLPYRGLSPENWLFVSQERDRISAYWLSELLSTIFRRAGVRASPSRSARVTLAHRLMICGADRETVMRIVGVRSQELLRRAKRTTGAAEPRDVLAVQPL